MCLDASDAWDRLAAGTQMSESDQFVSGMGGGLPVAFVELRDACVEVGCTSRSVVVVSKLLRALSVFGNPRGSYGTS